MRSSLIKYVNSKRIWSLDLHIRPPYSTHTFKASTAFACKYIRMSTTAEPWRSSASDAAGRLLVQLGVPLLNALGSGDLESARGLSTEKLTPYLVSDSCRGVWNRRSAQIQLDPRDALWVTRLVVHSETGAVVGRAGFHGQPNQAGMVEVGYSIDPACRRQGNARAALTILLEVAAKDPAVKVVRATVRPDNVPSRSLLDQYGFREVGEQWDDEDGLEVILEKSI
jgi:ribosomal-protein-alanine N-acetyltransferase